jgi:hypothetical protein
MAAVGLKSRSGHTTGSAHLFQPKSAESRLGSCPGKAYDRSDTSMSMTNLLRRGATLASMSNRVGESCREVLRRYGQL